ncbi:hypothetical protein [Bradyrhizobium monzae]|uniref:hypothetical protein n=1 Tax=Bradyrhizobium sp. Oc8 TaxID=2876780 RepID=UPI001F165E3A|nr:hypothetical protein [Bradyrhizobium sp. Oc8]
MSRARLYAALLPAALTVSKPATAGRGNDFDSPLAQINRATQGGRWAAILLMIGNPADDRFAYNVTQEDAPCSVPVMVVGAKARGTFERALASGVSVTFDVSTLCGRSSNAARPRSDRA